MSSQRRWPSMRRTSRSTSVKMRAALVARGRVPRIDRTSLLCAVVLVLSACIMPGDASPVLKIGLLAPFEGLGRPLGYAVLPAVQEAIDSGNASGELGPYRLLLVAFNDELDPATAAAQAAALAQDPAVVAVVGPFTTATAAQAVPLLSAAGLPVLVAAPLGQAPAGVFPLCPNLEAITGEIERAAERAAARTNITSCSDDAIDNDPQNCALNPELEALSEANSAFEDSVTTQAYWPGEAAEAAAWLVGEQATGSARSMLGGPDVLKPWFIERAGETGEGTRAIACSLSGTGAAKEELPEVALARAATERIVQALAARVQAGVGPTRAEIAAELRAQQFEPGLVWYQVIAGEWQPLDGP